MARSHHFHWTPARAVIFAVLHVSAVLLLLRVRTPKYRPNLDHNPLHRTAAMSNAPTNASAWTQSRLTSLYEATDDSFHDAFDRTFSPACEVRLNHAVRPLQTFKDDLASRRGAATHVGVAWSGEVLSTNDDTPEQVRAAGTLDPGLADRDDGGGS